MRLRIGLLVTTLLLTAASCPGDDSVSPDGTLLLGTWGGDNVGLIVEENVAHLHIGCTNGDFPAPLVVDDDGRFNVEGSYVLRAYPIQVGPSLPARFAGVITGTRMTLTVAVDDTVEKKLVVLGPVTATYKREPRLGPCPICIRRGAS